MWWLHFLELKFNRLTNWLSFWFLFDTYKLSLRLLRNSCVSFLHLRINLFFFESITNQTWLSFFLLLFLLRLQLLVHFRLFCYVCCILLIVLLFRQTLCLYRCVHWNWWWCIGSVILVYQILSLLVIITHFFHLLITS